ncbi:hypothetical protein [Mycobacterium asiaticum]|uniref:Uncharacterized protein n=1 Tax=Mycobacterium asiaticum TaxID=1790 RepID=A0A1A3N8V8_MYCAS|nr:hypothetical protein [Mycobacterium asiaticum]OBK18588.1 hypothetical protein A5636_20275 [Mycobacterium asiaticum]
MMIEPRTAYVLKDGSICLATLADGFELDPPWAYSDNQRMTLGMTRFQIVVDDSLSDAEIGQRIRAALFGIERKTLLDIQAYSPAS